MEVKPVERLRCPRCHGDGTVERGRIRDDLSYSTATCPRCDGLGTVEVPVRAPGPELKPPHP